MLTLLREPVIIDGRNLFDQERMHANGFTYLSIGRPAVRAGESAHQV
jgi:UDPglucose 6-dehydrogenase